MSNYRLDVNGSLELSDYSDIYDYISIVDTRDEFIIRLNSVSNENFNMVCTILKERGFKIQPYAIGDDKWEINAEKAL